MRGRRLVAGATVLSALALGAAACGIPSDDQPRAIPENNVPEAAVQPHGTGPTSSVGVSDATQDETIYLVMGSDQTQWLQPVTVGVPVPSDPSQLPRLTIDKLIATRPDDVGLAGQATNQVPSDVRVLDANVQPDGVLNLNLTSPGVENVRLRLAIAQIVYTAIDLKGSGINAVRVAFDGTNAAVPTQSGNVDAGTPVTKNDYADLSPSSQPQG